MAMRHQTESRGVRVTTGTFAGLARRCVTVALLLAATGWPGPAHAHSELVTSSPGHGSEVSLSTDRIVLVFDSALSPVGNALVVRGPDADDVGAAASQTSGNTLEMKIDLVSPGRHTVSYRFVGQDGHAASGHLWFTAVADGAPHSATAVLLRGTQPPDAPAGTASAGGDPRMWLLPLIGLAGGLVLLHSAAASRQRSHPTRSGGS